MLLLITTTSIALLPEAAPGTAETEDDPCPARWVVLFSEERRWDGGESTFCIILHRCLAM